jgi:hypothetical protein
MTLVKSAAPGVLRVRGYQIPASVAEDARGIRSGREPDGLATKPARAVDASAMGLSRETIR